MSLILIKYKRNFSLHCSNRVIVILKLYCMNYRVILFKLISGCLAHRMQFIYYYSIFNVYTNTVFC